MWFPLDQAAIAIQLADGVDVGYKVVVPRNWPGEFDLQFTARLANANAVVLAKSV
jgi:hypothetical protein